MMDALRCTGVILILLGLHASLIIAEPRAKAELGRGKTKTRAHTSVMVASSRRSLLRRKTGFQASDPSSRNLADYKMEIARKMAQVRTPLEFLRVFFPVDTVKSRWTKMVNESVQNAWRVGRTGTNDVDTERPTFTEETSDRMLQEIYSYGKNISCGEPKPVLIDMYEELNLTRGGLVYLYPECMLVRRCEGSGCCSGGAPCVGKANTRENVSRPCVIMRVVPESMHRDLSYIRHSLYADTECVCKERPRTPECEPLVCSDTMTFDEVTCRCACTKPCPKPYQQDEGTCDCKCADKDGGCNKIKRARRRMAAADCRCVMEERCLHPACKKGFAFNTRSCKCTQSETGRVRSGGKNPSRNGRTNTKLPYPPPRGRTDFNPSPTHGRSSADSESEAPPGFSVNNYSSQSEYQETLRQEELLVTWDSEVVPRECGSSCQESVDGTDNGSGDSGAK